MRECARGLRGQRGGRLAESQVESASAELLQWVTGYRITQALYVFAKLGVADHLADGPKDAAVLARQVGVLPDPLHRILRALASVGALTVDASGRFGLTRTTGLLRTGGPDSRAPFVVFQGEESYRAFGDLLHTVKTGETAFDHVYGMGHFEYLAQHPVASATFNAAMATSARFAASPLDGYDFSDHRTIVDIGGGTGALLGSILRANPGMRGILYDLPSAVAEAPSHLAAMGVQDRCEIRTGSAFESVPAGADVYLMSRILHDFADERALVLLRNCRRAVPAGGLLLLREGVLAETDIPRRRALLDLEMMALNGGRERTEAEWRALLGRAGFSLSRIWPSRGMQDLIEARPA